MDEIHDEEIKEWLDDCPTHKWEIKSCNENGIWISVRFNNEKEDDET